jgi:lysine-N-methylase
MPAKHYLVPDYVLDFKCACCTECCKRWRIIIDKQAVEKYEKLASTDEELFALLAGGLKKDKSGQGMVQLENRLSRTTVQDGGEEREVAAVDAAICPFLGADGLCVIQRKYGAEALSDTCKIFPRSIFLTERGYEMSLTYACATAAQTLKNRNSVEFHQNPAGYGFFELYEQYGKIGGVLDRMKAGKTNYFDVEELLIDIMQFREMDVETRLVLAGIIINKLKDGDIPGIRKYLQNLDADLIGQLKSIPSQPGFMMKLVKEAVDKRLLIRGISEKDMNRLLVLAYGQLKLLDEATVPEEKVQRFLDQYNELYKPFTGDISHVYENYFVNFIFSKKFYTYKYRDTFFLMVFFYVLIRFFAVCVCMAEERNVDEDTVVEVISAVERSIGHNKTYYEDVLRLVKKGDYHRLPYVVSLINL